MTQVPSASGTKNLRPPAVCIRLATNGSGNLIIETGPATTGIELVFRPVQRGTATAATIGSIFAMGIKFAGKGRFRPFPDNHSLLFGGQRFHVLCF